MVKLSIARKIIDKIELSEEEESIIYFIKTRIRYIKPIIKVEYPTSTFYICEKTNIILFDNNQQVDRLRTSYKYLWQVLEKKYKMDYINIQLLLKVLVEEKLKTKIPIPISVLRIVM